MHLFSGSTADEVWLKAAHTFRDDAHIREQESRAGNTFEIMGGIFEISDPRQRWVASRRPAINPAFAIAEVIWIVTGRRDAAFLNFWNPKLPEFAGNVRNYHGAYGYRLHSSHKVNQLERAYHALLNNENSRQVVLQIWHPTLDLPKINGSPASPDVPCNLTSLLKVRDGKLEWTQILRSNDLVLGVPHNFVQFTSIQEIMAAWLGVDVGPYRHYSDCLHIYSRDKVNTDAATAVDLPHNTARIRFTKQESDILFSDLSKRMRVMISPKLSRKKLEVMAYHHSLTPELYDWFLILAADCARRNGWPDLVAEFNALCGNPTLKSLWASWYERCKKIQARKGQSTQETFTPPTLQQWLPIGPVSPEPLHS